MPTLDPAQFPPRPAGPAGGGPTLGDMLPSLEELRQHMVCWRCGAIAYESSPCTEKRGDGPPWRHEFMDRRSMHPWPDWPLAELIELARYLAGKSASSLATAKAFDALVRAGDRIPAPERERQSHRFAAALYANKAAKRIRLLDWVVAEVSRRGSSDPLPAGWKEGQP